MRGVNTIEFACAPVDAAPTRLSYSRPSATRKMISSCAMPCDASDRAHTHNTDTVPTWMWLIARKIRFCTLLCSANATMKTMPKKLYSAEDSTSVAATLPNVVLYSAPSVSRMG